MSNIHNRYSIVLSIALSSLAWGSQSADLRLVDAINSLDIDRVKSVMARGVKPNWGQLFPLIAHKGDEARRIEIYRVLMSDVDLKKSVYLHGLTALITHAVSHDSLGFVEVFHRAISEKSRLDGPTLQSLLGIAVRQSSFKMVEILLNYGANPNRPVKKTDGIVYVDMPIPYQATVYALGSAAYLGRKDVAELCLSHGADINIQDADGESALHSAALKPNNAMMIRFLLSRGATKSLKTHRGETALEIAIRKGYKSNVEALRGP